MIRIGFLSLIRHLLLFVGVIISRILFNVSIYGRENLRQDKALILVSNHFSWFDAPLLAILLPYQPSFLVATESQKRWFVRVFIRLFKGIPVWRGQVDRTALRSSLDVLENGGVLGIFPEGGIDPEVSKRVSRGEHIENITGHASRLSAQLVRPRPGVALLANESGAELLPVALRGTEHILANLLKFRRTTISLRIGQVFGPLSIDPDLQGRAKRLQLDTVADTIMQHVAALFPAEQRGPYQEVELEQVIAQFEQNP